MDILEMLLLPCPRYLAGMRFGDWLSFLHAHRWRIDPAFWPRCVVATACSLVTSLVAAIERATPPPAVDEEAWRSPLFVLGLPRSGTTHLFQLLSRDPRFCHPTRFDCFHPHTFRTLRSLGIHRLFALVPAQRRAMDGVMTDWLSPEEDDIAIAILAGGGERLDSVFPRDPPKPLTPATFEAAMMTFTRGIVGVHGRPVILKSPRHTGRVASILRAFPGARFVMIHRNPLDVMGSASRLGTTRNRSWCTLQWPNPERFDELAQRLGKRLDCYVRDKRLIPAGQLAEIRYEELVAD